MPNKKKPKHKDKGEGHYPTHIHKRPGWDDGPPGTEEYNLLQVKSVTDGQRVAMPAIAGRVKHHLAINRRIELGGNDPKIIGVKGKYKREKKHVP